MEDDFGRLLTGRVQSGRTSLVLAWLRIPERGRPDPRDEYRKLLQ